MNFPAKHIEALTQLGYVAREAEFLYIVAVHSGFFVQRQFIQYAGVAGRGPITDFLRKAIQRKHVREHLPERGSQKVYQLFSRNLYASIEKEHSRNRRTGRYGLLDKASVKLLSLDFVLANLKERYLEEEVAKVEYFTAKRQIARATLPTKVFHGQEGSETHRYFVEKFPMFLSGTAGEEIVNFTYLEDDLRSLQSFGTYLERYRPLFEALNSKFKLIFVSNSTQSFPSAKRVFLDMFSSVRQTRERHYLARFFWLRKMAEEKRFKELVHKDVIDWQRGLKQYSGPDHERHYQTWTQTGQVPELDSGNKLAEPAQVFETYLVISRTLRPAPSTVGAPAGLSADLDANSDAREGP
jgi:hypothetical protein